MIRNTAMFRTRNTIVTAIESIDILLSGGKEIDNNPLQT